MKGRTQRLEQSFPMLLESKVALFGITLFESAWFTNIVAL